MFQFTGAAGHRRDIAKLKIDEGVLGEPIVSRVKLLTRLHEAALAQIAMGHAAPTIRSKLDALRSFYMWADKQGEDPTEENIETLFLAWGDEAFLDPERHWKGTWRSRIVRFGRLLVESGAILRVDGSRWRQKKLEPQPKRRKTNSSMTELLLETQAFGEVISALCNELTEEKIRGPRPIQITLDEQKSLIVLGGVKRASYDHNLKYIGRPQSTSTTLPIEVSTATGRQSLVNLRIEAELQMFIAQTGMNLSQAAQLTQEAFRWQTREDEAVAIRSYKGRRAGEVIFTAFRSYKSHLGRYLSWLDRVGLSSPEGRLFPFQFPGKIPSRDVLPVFRATARLCSQVGIRHIRPQELRSTRVNWLLEKSEDWQLTAALSAHTRGTLESNYAKPDDGKARRQLSSFMVATENLVESAGPGRCASPMEPRRINGAPVNIPEPDCVNPDGCVFCDHHRDLDTFDYAWKLLSHLKLKLLELHLDLTRRALPDHPARATINQIIEKLDRWGERSKGAKRFIAEASKLISQRKYHPTWAYYLEAAESLIGLVELSPTNQSRGIPE